MDPVIKQEESSHLKFVLKKLNAIKTELNTALTSLGAGNVDRLKELRENSEGGLDFLMFIEQLHEKNEAFNIKDKFQRLQEYEFLLKEPYFARLDIQDNSPKDPSKAVEKIYLGKFGFTEDGRPIVIDWRARIASIYYRYRYPQKNVSFEAPATVALPESHEVRDLLLKRTYEIEDGELIKYYNNDIQLDESEIIRDKIGQRTGGVLEDIVETIQTSQLDIIEADPRQVCIVQGCVGSGKSTVAIHKLAHIFFNYPTIIHPEKSILIAKNQILIGYLSTLFPKLGIFDIYYKTLRELVVHLIFREELGVTFDLEKDQDTSSFGLDKIKGTYSRLDQVHQDIELKLSNIFDDPDADSFAGFKYSRINTPYQNVSEALSEMEEEITMQREFIKENPENARTYLYKENVKLLRNIVKRLSELGSELRNRYFLEFLKREGINRNRKLSFLETLKYLFIYSEIIGISKFPKFEYCVVDEGQDFSALEYLVLSKIVNRGRFAIFGDLNQSLEVDGINNWKDLPEVISEAKSAALFELSTNYRSTKPIIDLANSILLPYTSTYLPKSINRKGDNPIIANFESREKLMTEFETQISGELIDLNKSIGIICYDHATYEATSMLLDAKKIPEDKVIKLESSIKIRYIPKGVYLMHFEDCKGLEFAKVYVLGLNLEKIKEFRHAREAFVAVTRAMNELHVYGIN